MINFGLMLIAIGWLYQVARLLKGDKKIQPIFLGFYVVGVLSLMIESSSFVSWDGASFIFALTAFILLMRKK